MRAEVHEEQPARERERKREKDEREREKEKRREGAPRESGVQSRRGHMSQLFLFFLHLKRIDVIDPRSKLQFRQDRERKFSSGPGQRAQQVLLLPRSPKSCSTSTSGKTNKLTASTSGKKKGGVFQRTFITRVKYKKITAFMAFCAYFPSGIPPKSF